MALIHVEHLHLHVTISDPVKVDELIKKVNINHTILNKILMTNEELKALLDTANTKADKISAEVIALKDKIVTTPGIPQDIVDAATTLASKLQGIDDLNEDAVS